MTSTPPDVESWTREVRTLGVGPEGLRVNDKGTLFDEGRSGAQSRAIVLPRVVGGPQGDEIIVHAPIGRGGMGEVLVATQTSLDREVAVKRPADAGRIESTLELMLEARVAGALEHPNIIPVHILGSAADGTPLLVMKRIEGKSWRSLLSRGADLSRDLAILMDVCRALHFAHSRGVVHRDVKPENVMVGEHGDVYLFDWGVCAGLEGCAVRGIPPARTQARIVGTPGYMAPEMVWPDATVDARTDVFLAGAVLHEVLTGKPPHQAETTWDSLKASFLCAAPSIPPDVPDELADICRRALRRDPAERFATAEELRQALEWFREHAAARELIHEAEGRLTALRALPADVEAATALPTYDAARFAFEQALQIWPESQQARHGIDEVITAMAQRELTMQRLDSAELLVRELKAPAPHLLEELERLRSARALEARSGEDLARLSRATDGTVAQRERQFVLVASAVGWLVFLGGLEMLIRAGHVERDPFWFAVFGVAGVVGIGLTGWLRPSLLATSMSRSSFIALWLGMLGNCTTFAVSAVVGVDMETSLLMSGGVLATALASSAAWDPRVWPAAIAAFAMATLLVAAPAWSVWIHGIGTALALVLSSLWRPPFMRPAASDAQQQATDDPPRSPP